MGCRRQTLPAVPPLPPRPAPAPHAIVRLAQTHAHTRMREHVNAEDDQARAHSHTHTFVYVRKLTRAKTLRSVGSVCVCAWLTRSPAACKACAHVGAQVGGS